MISHYTASLQSPLGWISVQATDTGITQIDFAEAAPAATPNPPQFLQQCIGQLEEYFAGTRRDFTDLPLAFAASNFQRAVWDATADIPYGQTLSYGEVASKAGSPDAARAVGNALHRNPLCVIVPCHRVVPSTGETGQYAGGTWRKEWLLTLEKRK